ncbi:MAG: Rieske (2Fe-2S) protein [Arenimonas sp.]
MRREDLPRSGIVAVDAVISGERESILIRCTEPTLRAWLNVCPHQGRRLDYVPGKFLIDGSTLVCAAHGATFRLDDGRCIAGPCRGQSLREVSVQVADDGTLLFAALD